MSVALKSVSCIPEMGLRQLPWNELIYLFDAPGDDNDIVLKAYGEFCMAHHTRDGERHPGSSLRFLSLYWAGRAIRTQPIHASLQKTSHTVPVGGNPVWSGAYPPFSISFFPKSEISPMVDAGLHHVKDFLMGSGKKSCDLFCFAVGLPTPGPRVKSDRIPCRRRRYLS